MSWGCSKRRPARCAVFGLDPVTHPVEVLGRIGYLSEDRDLPGWMRVGELLRYTRAFYPSWDDGFAEELRRSFQLDPAARLKDLSQGQRARAGLLVALAYRPDLLVLDEPSNGARPGGEARHPGGDHPDDRRRGEDGPVLVAPARGGGAGLGPGGDARPGEGGPVGSPRRDQRGTPPAHDPVRRAAVPSAGVRRVTGPGGGGARLDGGLPGPARSDRGGGRSARGPDRGGRRADARRDLRGSRAAPVASSRWRPDS